MKWNRIACVMSIGVVFAGMCGVVHGVSCTTGSPCTRCYGYYAYVYGTMYCSNFSTGETTRCSLPGVSAAYIMSPCCDETYHAVGEPTGCYAEGCPENASVALDAKSCECNIGYYGELSNSTGKCTQCPTLNGVKGTTSQRGKKYITDCFIPTDETITDSSGKYKFIQECHYTR